MKRDDGPLRKIDHDGLTLRVKGWLRGCPLTTLPLRQFCSWVLTHTRSPVCYNLQGYYAFRHRARGRQKEMYLKLPVDIFVKVRYIKILPRAEALSVFAPCIVTLFRIGS